MGDVQDTECLVCIALQAEIHEIEMCPRCKRQILPQLKQPGWARLIGFTNPTPEPESVEPAVKKARRRNARKYGKLAVKADPNLTPHFCAGGCSTPVHRNGLMCGPCGEDVRARNAAPPRREVSYRGFKGAA